MTNYAEMARQRYGGQRTREAATPNYADMARKRFSVEPLGPPVSQVGDEAERQPSNFILKTPDGKQQRRFKAVDTENEFAASGLLDFTSSKRFGFAAEAGKFTTEGKVKFLEEKLGRGSVFVDDQGQIFVLPPEEREKPPEEQVPMVLNRPGLSKADLAFVPAAISGAATGAAVAPAALAAGGAKGLGVLAASGAAHAGGRQAFSEVLPGDDNATLSERAVDLGISAAGEVLFPVLGMAVRGTGSLVRSPVQRTVGHIAGRDPLAKKAIEEGLELGERTGIDFTTAQLAQTNLFQRVERFFSQQLGSGPLRQGLERTRGQLEQYAGNIAEKMNRRVVDSGAVAEKLVGIFGKKLEDVGKSADAMIAGVEREGVATSVVESFTSKLDDLVESRRKSADALFGRVSAATGDRAIMPLNNALEEIDVLVKEMSSDLSSDSSRTAVKFLKARKQELLNKTVAGAEPRVTANSFKNSLSDWSKASARPEGAIEGLSNRGMTEMIATRIANALRRDLDQAVEMGLPGSAQLVAARNTYAAQSAAIREMTNSPLAKLIEDPERLITRLLSKDKSGTSRQIMKTIDKVSPAQASQVRSAVLSDALKDVKQLSNGLMDPESLSRALSKKWKQLSVVFEGDPTGLKRLNDLKMSAHKLRGNPLAKAVGDTDELLKAFRKQSGNKDLRSIVRFAKDADPRLAEDIGSAFMQDLVSRAAPRGTELVTRTLNPTSMANLIKNNWGAIRTAVGSDSAAIKAVKDLEMASRRIASTGFEGSQTQMFQVMQRVFGAVGVGAGFAVGTTPAGAASILAGMFTMNRVASAFANPYAAKAYAEVMQAAASPEALKKAATRASIKQAIGDIITWNARIDEGLRGSSEEP